MFKKYVGKKRLQLPDILTEKEVQELFKLDESKKIYIPKKIWKKNTKVQLMLMYYCGLRVSEMINLKVEDVDFKKGFLKVVCGKFGKDRIVPIPKPLAEELKIFLKGKKEGKLFKTGVRNIQKKMERIGKQYFNKSLYPHILRHSYATHVLEKTGNLELVRDLLGHTSITSTIVYTHLSTSTRKKAIDSIWKS